MTREEKLKDIRENLSRHKHHNMNGLMLCATTKEGAIDTSIMRAHEALYGSNGGVKCDVGSGPCSCGAWH